MGWARHADGHLQSIPRSLRLARQEWRGQVKSDPVDRVWNLPSGAPGGNGSTAWNPCGINSGGVAPSPFRFAKLRRTHVGSIPLGVRGVGRKSEIVNRNS